MKLEKEVKIIKVHSENSIIGDNYTEIKIDGALSHKDFRNIANNFTGKKIKLTLEVEEPILDEAERKYLSGVIRPFRNRIEFIRKCCIFEREYINIVYNSEFIYDNNFNLPTFEEDKMYKNMELDKEYTLEELEL